MTQTIMASMTATTKKSKGLTTNMETVTPIMVMADEKSWGIDCSMA